MCTSSGSDYGGTIFELSPSGNSWTFSVLYNIHNFGWTCGPQATLTLDAAGNLYGTTNCDGTQQEGNVFKLSNTQNGWVYTSLHDFMAGNDGFWPIGGVAIASDGTLYGTAMGGADSSGVVWMIKP